MRLSQSVCVADSGSADIADPATVIWELRGVNVVTCTVRHARDGVDLQILHGYRCLARERCRDAHEAFQRASEVRRELLARGWRVAGVRLPRPVLNDEVGAHHDRPGDAEQEGACEFVGGSL